MRNVLLSIILLATACSPLRHYRHVALDPYRNAAELALLAKACTEEFKPKEDTPRVVFTGIDSSAYLELAQYSNSLIDSLIAKGQDTAQGIVYKCSSYDSARIVRRVIASFKPATIIKTEIREVKVRDPATELLLQTQINAARAENTDLISKAKTATDKQAATRKTNIWLYIIAGLSVVTNGYLMFKRKIV